MTALVKAAPDPKLSPLLGPMRCRRGSCRRTLSTACLRTATALCAVAARPLPACSSRRQRSLALAAPSALC